MSIFSAGCPISVFTQAAGTKKVILVGAEVSGSSRSGRVIPTIIVSLEKREKEIQNSSDDCNNAYFVKVGQFKIKRCVESRVFEPRGRLN
ncbi:unnamed protein product, partial [Nesidiocoris tenuis]